MYASRQKHLTATSQHFSFFLSHAADSTMHIKSMCLIINRGEEKEGSFPKNTFAKVSGVPSIPPPSKKKKNTSDYFMLKVGNWKLKRLTPIHKTYLPSAKFTKSILK